MFNMDTEGADGVYVAKPVASRPFSLRKFSEILAGEINSMPSDVDSETVEAAIRPKAVRFKPIVLPASADVSTSQAETSRNSVSSPSDKGSGSDSKLNVVYKPVPRLVPKAAISVLANTVKFGTGQQQTETGVEDRNRSAHQNEEKSRSQLSINCPQKIPLHAEERPKCLTASISADHALYDGYNWRKYGQNQVKGSEYPRGYYKCTYPNCPVKKIVERSFDGHIAGIVYKGEHNHPKLLPPNHNCSTTLGLGYDGSGQDAYINDNHGMVPAVYNPAGMTNTHGPISKNSCRDSRECEAKEGSKGTKLEFGAPGNKKRKSEKQPIEAGISRHAVQGQPTLIQNSIDSEISGSGFRWRKYGQKVVKGNSYPRSYYKCTSPKCNARKHVERTSDDPNAVITTYEGKHSHDILSRDIISADGSHQR